jgi:predicted DNA-binding protein (MmcQ/YjbR family)
MNIEEIRETCLAKPAVTEGFPFGQDVLVFKVMNKIFPLTGLEGDPPFVNPKYSMLIYYSIPWSYDTIKVLQSSLFLGSPLNVL